MEAKFSESVSDHWMLIFLFHFPCHRGELGGPGSVQGDNNCHTHTYLQCDDAVWLINTQFHCRLEGGESVFESARGQGASP